MLYKKWGNWKSCSKDNDLMLVKKSTMDFIEAVLAVFHVIEIKGFR